MKIFLRFSCFSLLVLAMFSTLAGGHTVPKHSRPKAGETLSVSPKRVRIWFDGALHAASCSLQVHDGDGGRVDKGDGHVDDSDPTLIEASLPALPSGTYSVIWNIVSRDGHRTQGDYTFTVK